MKSEETLNGAVPPFKGPLPGPRWLPQQKLADIKQMCSTCAAGKFLALQEALLTECPLLSPNRTQLKLREKYNKVSKHTHVLPTFY